MLRAAETGETVLVLTAGIPLQEQLIQKDRPLLNELLGLSLPFGLLKGKGNYACRSRAEVFEEEKAGRGIFRTGTERSSSRTVEEWLRTTTTGDLSELSLPRNSPSVAGIAASSRSCKRIPLSEAGECCAAVLSEGRVARCRRQLPSLFSYLLSAGKPFRRRSTS